MTEDNAIRLIREVAADSPDLVKANFRRMIRAGAHPVTGHCYVACEVLCDFFPGKYQPHVVRLTTGTHWFVKNKSNGEIIDPTAEQFDNAVPYAHGRPAAFLTSKPSRRAQVFAWRVMKKVHKTAA